MLSDSIGSNTVSGTWPWRLERLEDRGTGATHGERGNVSDDGGGHGGGTTPDRITEEKPGIRESVADAYAAAAEGRGEDEEEKTATGERDNDAEVRATKQSSAGDRWWDRRRIVWMRMQLGEMERRSRQNNANGKQTSDDSRTTTAVTRPVSRQATATAKESKKEA